jgi:hypothetical protein
MHDTRAMPGEETAMKALLVYPEFPDTFWSFKHALSFVHKPANSRPSDS